MWAPECAYRNGTSYFNFPHPSETKWNDTWKIGVTTSAKLASDFEDAGYTIDFCSATPEKAKIHLTINGTDYSFLNTPVTGSWDQYIGHTMLTVPLKAGNGNVVEIDGGTGGVNISNLTVTPLP